MWIRSYPRIVLLLFLAGFFGDGINGRENPIIPFDCTRFHSNTDDAPSQVINLDLPFNIGEETFTSFRVSPNGYVIGGTASLRVYNPPALLQNFPNPIVAGLFSDFDLSSGARVCYDVIYKGSATESQLNTQDRVDDIVKKYKDGNYISNMIILVHWKNVARYPASTSGSIASNFQVIISTNGKDSYAILNHGRNNWYKDSNFFISGYTSGTGDFKLLEGSGTIRSNNFANLMGNSGIRGRNILYMSQFDPSPHGKCESWIKDATTYPPSVLTCSMCPPTIQHAFIERHWLWFDSTSKCKHISSSVYTFMVNFRTRGSYDYNPGHWTRGICTYKVAIEGSNLRNIFCADHMDYEWHRRHSLHQLQNYLNSNEALQTSGELMTNLPYAGTLQVPTSNSNWGYDGNERYGRKICIDRAKMYTQFSKVRPVCNADRFNEFKDVMQRFRGDPHLTTLDGVEWSFNGIGEYIMVRSSRSASVRGLEVQARLERASSAVPNVTSRATVFTGFAARTNGSDIVQTLYNRSASDIDIYIDNKWTTSMRSLLNEDTYFNFTGGFIETSGNNTVSVSFDQGIGLNVEKTLNFIQLTFFIQSTLKNQLEGLMGNFNDNKLDDFITPDGSVIASNSSERELYRYGLTWRITNQSKSLFTYQPGESVSTFFDPNFEPVYVEDFQDPLKLLGLFSNNSELLSKANETCHHPERSVYLSCMYDSAQMQTVDAAISAIQTNEEFTSVKKVLDNTPPYFEMPNSLNLTIGDVVKLPIWVSDKENDTVILEYSETGSPNISFTITLDAHNCSSAHAITLNVTDYTKFRPTITAKDSKGAVSLYRPTIYMCHCLNGGKCDFAYLSSSLANGNEDGVYLAQCQCGRFSGERCEVHPCDTVPSPCYDREGCRYDNETLTCRPCPAGMDGNGTTCYDRDECTPSPCEDVCINTDGSYLCQCNKTGYRVSPTNSSRCEDIDECTSNTTHTCKSDEICRNNAGGYECLCPTGYRKDVFGVCEEDPILPFACTNHSSNTDDAPSQVINLDFPFNIGKETFTTFRVSPNGYLIGGSHSLLDYNIPGVLEHFPYPIVAGLSGDFDLTMGAKVCYDVIYKRSATNSQLEIQNRVDDIVKKYKAENYISNMIILVDWKNVTRYPATLMSDQTTNFQVIISTNGKDTYAILNHGENSWYKESNFFISGYTSGTGDSKVLEGSGTNRSNDFTNQMGNTGIRGRNVLYMSHFDLSPQRKCERWINSLGNYPNNPTCSMCPPTIQQAFIERHWLWFDSTAKCKHISSSVYTFMANFRTSGSYEYNPEHWTYGICTYKVAIEGGNLKNILCADSTDYHWDRNQSMYHLQNYLNSEEGLQTSGNLMTTLPYAGTLRVFATSDSNWGYDGSERYGKNICIEKAQMYTQFSNVRPVCNSDRFDDFKDVMGTQYLISQGKPTSQINNAQGRRGSSRAVDGNTNQDMRGHSCSYTGYHLHAWWQVDLQREYNIRKVRIFNRKDCCGDSLSNFVVQIWRSGSWTTCARYPYAALDGQVITLDCKGYGRLVRVMLLGKNYLTLCEVQVYAK